MSKHHKATTPQAQTSKPPHIDAPARDKQKAEEEEVAGRHKNDGANDHQGNQRRPDTSRSD